MRPKKSGAFAETNLDGTTVVEADEPCWDIADGLGMESFRVDSFQSTNPLLATKSLDDLGTASFHSDHEETRSASGRSQDTLDTLDIDAQSEDTLDAEDLHDLDNIPPPPFPQDAPLIDPTFFPKRSVHFLPQIDDGGVVSETAFAAASSAIPQVY